MIGLNTIKWRLAQKLERLWWKRYLKDRSVEDYLNWKKKYWRSFLKEIDWGYVISKSDRLLDAGCGPAGIFTIFEDYDITALDPLLEQYNQDLAHFNFTDYPSVSFKALPFERFQNTALFDVVFCLNAINHFRDFKGSISRLKQLVSPGGYLVLSIDVHNYSLLKYIFRMLPGDALHPQQHSSEDYLNLLKDKSFVVSKHHVKDRGFVFNYEVLVLKRLN